MSRGTTLTFNRHARHLSTGEARAPTFVVPFNLTMTTGSVAALLLRLVPILSIEYYVFVIRAVSFAFVVGADAVAHWHCQGQDIYHR
jgi:hypothetical protein